jgi:hypothetical protein
MSITLTTNELTELTGYLQPKKQNEWLQHQGFIFRVAADGRARVDRSHYLKQMDGITEKSSRAKTSPDFSTLEKK